MCVLLLGMYHWVAWISGSFYLMKHSWKHTFTSFVFASYVLQCFVLVPWSIVSISLVANKICQIQPICVYRYMTKTGNPLIPPHVTFSYSVCNQLLNIGYDTLADETTLFLLLLWLLSLLGQWLIFDDAYLHQIIDNHELRRQSHIICYKQFCEAPTSISTKGQ